MSEYQFRSEPYKHQREEWERSRSMTSRGILWEQGTGKSKLIIDTACYLWSVGQIDGVLVIAPNGVHRNWVTDEIPTHVPVSILSDVRALYWQSSKAANKSHQKEAAALLTHPKFAWLTMSYDAFVTKLGKKMLQDFLGSRRVLYVLDESHYVKTPNAERTKSVLRSARWGLYRRILTGTPISVGPFDMYSQIKFLNEGFWKSKGLSGFTEFKQFFGNWTKEFNHNIDPRTGEPYGEYDALVSYRRLPILEGWVAEICSRVTKEEVLDLPPKVYTTRRFILSPEQQRLYRQMRDDCVAWILENPTEAAAPVAPEVPFCTTCGGSRYIEQDGYVYACPDHPEEAPEEISGTAVIASLAIVKLLRLQQICSGYLPGETPSAPLYAIPGPNRRLEELMSVIEEAGGKVIVWARFQEDINLIIAELARQKIPAVRYDGQVDDDGRAEAKARFQGLRPRIEGGQVVGQDPVPEEEQARVFVGNPAAGSTGLTLTAANTVVYYNNSFKLIERLQSEDRPHRIGQTKSVLYVDLCAEETVDERITEALKAKLDIARQITGDKLKEWIQ